LFVSFFLFVCLSFLSLSLSLSESGPWFVKQTSASLRAAPPHAICPVIKQRIKRESKKVPPKNKKASASGTGVLLTPVKFKKDAASFKRKAGFNRQAVSPFVMSVLKRRRHAGAAAKAAAACVAPEAPQAPALAAGAPKMVPRDPKHVPKMAPGVPKVVPKKASTQSLEELISYLNKCKVPQELHPVAMPNGAKGYTKRHTDNPSSVQVLHQREMYYLNYDRNGRVPLSQSITWGLYGGADLAWDHCKRVWELW